MTGVLTVAPPAEPEAHTTPRDSPPPLAATSDLYTRPVSLVTSEERARAAKLRWVIVQDGGATARLTYDGKPLEWALLHAQPGDQVHLKEDCATASLNDARRRGQKMVLGRIDPDGTAQMRVESSGSSAWVNVARIGLGPGPAAKQAEQSPIVVGGYRDSDIQEALRRGAHNYHARALTREPVTFVAVDQVTEASEEPMSSQMNNKYAADSSNLEGKCETAKPRTRWRKALDAAKDRVPVEWALGEAHALIVKWALGTVKDRQEKAFLKSWLDAQLRSPYGRAVLGGLLASPVGIPLLAQMIGRGEALADRIADEFAARAMTEGGVQLTRDLVRAVPKGAYKLAEALFTKFAEAEDARAGAAGDLPAPKHASQLPPTDPRHTCGLHCDGQDGYQSDCARARRGEPRRSETSS